MQSPNRPVVERFVEYCLDVGGDALMIDNALTFGARGREGQPKGLTTPLIFTGPHLA